MAHRILKTFRSFSGIALKTFLATVFLWVAISTQSLYATSSMLHISGNQIVNASGCTVRLKGMDVSGMEYDPAGDGGTGRPTTVISGVTMTDYVAIITEAVQTWHANFIRFPFNQDYWFGCTTNGHTPNQAAYQAMLQAVVNYCNQNNVYIALDLHWSGQYTGTASTGPCGGGGWGTSNGQQDMPDWNAVTLWSSVAATSWVKNNPAVLLDLYNEPHDVSWSVWQNGGPTGATPSQSPGLQKLLDTVRTAGANNVVIAGGLDWAYDLTGLSTNALTDSSGNGIVYAAHVYPSKGTAGSSTWDPKVTVATSSHAVIVSEFGQGTNDGGSWDNTLLGWLNGSNGNSYVYSGSAWCFSSDVGPTLLTSFSGFPTTSYHGAPVSTWLYNLNQTPTPNCGGSTPTFTFTPTKTNSPTFTNTATATRTNTPTSTSTNSSTKTNSWTATPSSTVTRTPTSTVTPTRSGTPTNTYTSTSSSTATPTRTYSPTNTNTFTFTATATATRTNTYTFTGTPTNTLVNTATPTSTATSTRSNTPTNTLVNSATPTSTATVTATFTHTHTPTNTLVSTATPTGTSTATFTPTYSNTPTKTSTFTGTATPTNTLANTATSTGTATLTLTPTASNTATRTYTSTSSSTFTSTSTGTLSPTQTFTPSSTPTQTGTSTFTATSTSTVTATFTMTKTNTLTATPSSTPSGTSTRTFTATATATHSSTKTHTPTVTFTGTFTYTATPTASMTPTASLTATSSPTTTFTVTLTPTHTPLPATQPVLYPNPVTGDDVALDPALSAVSDVTVSIFTTAFRKVNVESFPQVPAGASVQVILTDRSGTPLADGLYYVVVQTRQGRSILKLMILR